MNDVGKRPTKPGQMVMIVGASLPGNNGITGITRRRVESGTRHPSGAVYGCTHWECGFSRNPITALRSMVTGITKSVKESNCVNEKYLIVIADPDIDIGETESLRLPEGVPA